MKLELINYTKEISTFQLRAARYGLRLNANIVAKEAPIAPSSLSEIEAGDIFTNPKSQKLTFILKKYYESKGILFLKDNSIKFDEASVGGINFLHFLED